MSSVQLNIRPLSPEWQKLAIEELNEVPERIPDDLAALREWLGSQPHLKTRNSDQFLIGFLRGCKNSIEKAKKKLDVYYTMRTNFPEICAPITDVEKYKKLSQYQYLLSVKLPPSYTGPRLILCLAGNFPVEETNFFEVVRNYLSNVDLLIEYHDEYVIRGYEYVCDMSEWTLAHALQVTPTKLKRLMHYIENGIPLRIRAIHLINVDSKLETILRTILHFLPAKIQERTYVHSSMEDLYKRIPQKFLPKEYGGDGGSFDELMNDSIQTYIKYHDYILEERNYGTDEKLRPGKPMNFDSLGGVEGSFRKLNVD